LSSSSGAGVTRRRGRPPKFAEPSRALTLTLPERVIEVLAAVDPDVSRAVVRLALPEAKRARRTPAELVSFGRHAVIVVTPTRTLERQAGVTLVPLPDGRALISFEQPTTLAELELHLDDAIRSGRLVPPDRVVFEAISEILRAARLSTTVALRERHIIVLEAKRPSRVAPSAGRSRTRRP